MRIAIDARKIGDFGIGRYIRGLLRGLAAIRADEDYVVFAPAEGAEHIPRSFEHVTLRAPHYSIRELFVVGRAIDRARADLFHAPHYVVPFTSVPTIVTVHDLIHLRHRNPLARGYARTMIGRAVRGSAGVATVSEAVRDEIKSMFRVAPEKIAVTPNGVDEIFTPGPSREQGRYFLFVGNDKPHKNIPALLGAFERVRAADPGLRLVLCGAKFPQLRGLPALDVRGFVSDAELADLYRGAVALVMPSIEEGFGLPLVEAMACGTPAVISNAAALIEVAGGAALVADPRSLDEISGAMKRVAGEEEVRRTLAARSLERARSFTWERCARATRRLYGTWNTVEHQI